MRCLTMKYKTLLTALAAGTIAASAVSASPVPEFSASTIGVIALVVIIAVVAWLIYKNRKK